MKTKRIARCILAVGCFFPLTGCMKIGSRMVNQDRFDYAHVIGESSKKQALLNIVKVRYSDWPVFLDVEQLATSYSWEATAAAKGVIRTPLGADSDQVDLGLRHPVLL